MHEQLKQAQRLARAGRFDEAERLLAGLPGSAPHNAEAQHLRGSIAEARGDLAGAAAILCGAADANPHHFVLHAHAAAVLRALGRPDESIRYGRVAAALNPADAAIQNDLAIAFSDKGEYAAAELCARTALERDPRLAEAHNTLGLIARDTGRSELAVACFQRFLDARPGAALGQINLFDSYTVESAEDPNLIRLEARLGGDSLDPEDELLCRFAAAKAYGDLGRREEALRAAMRACALKRARVAYDEAASLAKFAEIRRVFTAGAMVRMRGGGAAGAQPVFIVSMPRAGSTLVEQILASHPSMFGAGELRDFADAAATAGPYPGAFDAAGPGHCAAIGERYLAGAAARAPAGSRMIDKMPANFLFAGLIGLALPDAKIVHVRRNAVDTCVSCFVRHFAAELNHTYDLAELGRYYRAYCELARHWRATLPGSAWLDVRYEDLIDDFEPQARRLLAFVGAPWDDSVLAFHRNPRPVKTHSVMQVRRPLYRTSVGRWRGLEPLLQPLLDALGDEAEAQTRVR